MTVRILKQVARDLKIKGFSRMNKAELIEAIELVEQAKARQTAEAEAFKASLLASTFAPIGEVKEEVAIEEEVVVEGEVAGTIKPFRHDNRYRIEMSNGWLMVAGSREEAIEKCQEEFKLNKQAEAEPTIAEFKELKPLSQEEFENTPIQQARKLIETEEVFSVKVSQTLNLSCYDDDEWDYTGMHGVMIYVEVLRPCNFTNEPRRTFITWSINLEGKSIEMCDLIGQAIFEEMKKYYPNTTFRKTVNDPQNEE